MKQKKDEKGSIVLAVIVVAIVVLLIKAISYIARPERVESGMIETLSNMEKRDPAKVQKNITEAKKLSEEGDKIENLVAERDFKKIYKNCLVCGEKLPVDMVKKACIEEKNIVGENKEDMEKSELKNPDTIFMLCGYGEIVKGSVTVKQYQKIFKEKMILIKNSYPESRIYVCLLPLPSREAVEKNPNLKKIADYNQVMKEESKRKNIPVIDLSDIKSTSEYGFKSVDYRLMLNRMAGKADL